MVLERGYGVSLTVPDWSVLDTLWKSRSRVLHEMVSLRKRLNTNHRQKMMSV